MPAYPAETPHNFLGLPPELSDYEHSRARLLPLPYETTVSYEGGARQGPEAILRASRQVELYDREFDAEPARDWGICTLPAPALDLSSGEAAVEGITAAVAECAAPGRLLAALGGEHTVSVGVARGLRQVFGDFLTVQLDAHADLRDRYEESPYSHACTARRICEFSPVVQLGLRSLDIEEAHFQRDHPERATAFFADEMRQDRGYLKALADRVHGRQVFLTIDLDVFDPAVMPAVGTPEPGGLFYPEVLEILRTVVHHSEVIGFDVVELAPRAGLHLAEFTAAKLIYKLFTLILSRSTR